jgi:hypothetical protein
MELQRIRGDLVIMGSFCRVGLWVTSRLGEKIAEENEEEIVIEQQRVEKPNSLS